jgi:hypothetical protein
MLLWKTLPSICRSELVGVENTRRRDAPNMQILSPNLSEIKSVQNRLKGLEEGIHNFASGIRSRL